MAHVFVPLFSNLRPVSFWTNRVGVDKPLHDFFQWLSLQTVPEIWDKRGKISKKGKGSPTAVESDMADRLLVVCHQLFRRNMKRQSVRGTRLGRGEGWMKWGCEPTQEQVGARNQGKKFWLSADKENVTTANAEAKRRGRGDHENLAHYGGALRGPPVFLPHVVAGIGLDVARPSAVGGVLKAG